MDAKTLQPGDHHWSDLQAFKRETLNAHNNYRTLHGCPPLLWSEELANTAQSWADKLAEKGFLQYSENPALGENICVVDLKDKTPKGEQVVKEWYKESTQYNYNKPGWKRGTHRFSQLLWKSTTEIGVGVSKIPEQDKAYVVVNYRPAGNNNMPGEFERNVLPPREIKRKDEANANFARNMIHR